MVQTIFLIQTGSFCRLSFREAFEGGSKSGNRVCDKL